MLQHTAPYYTTLYHTASHWSNTSQHMTKYPNICNSSASNKTLQHTTANCNTPYHTTPHYTTLHHTAPHYTTLASTNHSIFLPRDYQCNNHHLHPHSQPANSRMHCHSEMPFGADSITQHCLNINTRAIATTILPSPLPQPTGDLPHICGNWQ